MQQAAAPKEELAWQSLPQPTGLHYFVILLQVSAVQQYTVGHDGTASCQYVQAVKAVGLHVRIMKTRCHKHLEANITPRGQIQSADSSSVTAYQCCIWGGNKRTSAGRASQFVATQAWQLLQYLADPAPFVAFECSQFLPMQQLRKRPLALCGARMTASSSTSTGRLPLLQRRQPPLHLLHPLWPQLSQHRGATLESQGDACSAGVCGILVDGVEKFWRLVVACCTAALHLCQVLLLALCEVVVQRNLGVGGGAGAGMCDLQPT